MAISYDCCGSHVCLTVQCNVPRALICPLGKKFQDSVRLRRLARYSKQRNRKRLFGCCVMISHNKFFTDTCGGARKGPCRVQNTRRACSPYIPNNLSCPIYALRVGTENLPHDLLLLTCK
eukprot:scaffold13159_cov20-Prasinocladus_malaysianus.AAC.1